MVDHSAITCKEQLHYTCEATVIKVRQVGRTRGAAAGLICDYVCG